MDNATGKVIDIYGDFESPMNAGGLCAKGAGAFQLVTNPRRIGAWPAPHPVNNVFAAATTDDDLSGVAYKRIANGRGRAWICRRRSARSPALDDIAWMTAVTGLP